MQVTNSMAMFFNKQEDEENEDEEDEVFDSVHHTRIYDIFSFLSFWNTVNSNLDWPVVNYHLSKVSFNITQYAFIPIVYRPKNNTQPPTAALAELFVLGNNWVQQIGKIWPRAKGPKSPLLKH